MGHPAFEQTLVPVKGEQLERGDTVYERVQWGTRPGDVKLNKLRILGTLRSAARCEIADGTRRGQPVTIPFDKLLMEPKPDTTQTRVKLVKPSPPSEPPPAAKPEPRAPRPDSGQDFDALVEMGRDVLCKLEREEQSLEAEHTKIAHDVEALDANHRAHIEALEAELVAARRAHEEDRAFVAARVTSIEGRLAQLRRRRELLAALSA